MSRARHGLTLKSSMVVYRQWFALAVGDGSVVAGTISASAGRKPALLVKPGLAGY